MQIKPFEAWQVVGFKQQYFCSEKLKRMMLEMSDI